MQLHRQAFVTHLRILSYFELNHRKRSHFAVVSFLGTISQIPRCSAAGYLTYSSLASQKILYSIKQYIRNLTIEYSPHLWYNITVLSKGKQDAVSNLWCPLVFRRRVMPYECHGSSYIIACDIFSIELHWWT